MIDHFHFSEVGSTNDKAKELIEEHEKLFVSADFQTQGRGRRARVWLGNSEQNIALSFGVKHAEVLSADILSLYQAIGCLAVYDTLAVLCTKGKFRIKYPNDVMAFADGRYKKICGVLVEHSFSGERCQSSIIGIGVNINQSEFPEEIKDIAVSIKQLGCDFDCLEIMPILIDNILKYYYMPSEELLENWKNSLNMIGKKVNLLGNEENWIANRILQDGRLVIKNLETDEELTVSDGESIRYDYE